MGLGQYDGLGEYCGPHTASSLFLILLPNSIHICAIIMQYFHIQTGGKYCNRNTPNTQHFPLLTSGW